MTATTTNLPPVVMLAPRHVALEWADDQGVAVDRVIPLEDVTTGALVNLQERRVFVVKVPGFPYADPDDPRLFLDAYGLPDRVRVLPGWPPLGGSYGEALERVAAAAEELQATLLERVAALLSRITGGRLP